MSFRRVVALLLIVLPSLALADAVRWPDNGHFYEAVSVTVPITWEEASAAATAAGGYLATITSQAENNFVFTLVNNAAYWHGSSGPWLGGYQFPATQTPNANWRWVTGEAWSYTNWQTGQPNDSGGKVEDRLQFGFAPLTSNWNDIMSVDPTPAYRPTAYVVEWNNDPLAPTLVICAPTSSEVALCWETAPNRYYQLQWSSVLSTNQWVPLFPTWTTGDGAGHCEIDTIALGNPQKFYRLLCTNSPPQ